ncbi:MAG: PhzF family phenazine biosynthesis protein [Candidatus Marinimicrobia bacterium]|nr:PhzF family phenazine biosynthesis protein [Candidatus Neomarinimicrobiota bacterium]
MKLYHADAFTDTLFGGNPAAVCLLPEEDIRDTDKARIAAEMNLSETAFVLIKDGSVSLRWFTPEEEVDLCGHATLAAAHILWERSCFAETEVLRFSSRSGMLTAKKIGDKIELDFPRLSVQKSKSAPKLKKAFGFAPLYTGRNSTLYMIEIGDAGELRSLQPDLMALKNIEPGEFLITCRSDDPQYDFMSRYFAPGIGIPEDPVTGSAHCYLAPYWSAKLGKKTLAGFQASPRGGVVECELAGEGRVKLRGKAVTFFETEIFLYDRITECDRKKS